MKIGIIGKGFVGSAIEHGFSSNQNYKTEIKIYDKDPILSTHSLEQTVNESDIIFLSVPTPANKDGTINLGVVENVLFEIEKCQVNDGIIVLKSTVTPGSCEIFTKNFPKLKIVFNPEFLTEKNAKDDFINQSRIILGGIEKLTNKVAELYNWRFENSIPIIQTNFQTAELIKYMSNTFLATKVSFMNEMKMIADKANVDWAKAVKGFILDPRIGKSHTTVPGDDGKLGFGGTCFPKDIQALIKFSETIGIDTKIIKGAWETNLKVRPERDWEKLKGRSVVESED